jgi:hypothetical protein
MAQAVFQLLNYAATHPDASVRYTASDMTLHIESNASYLSLTKARSRTGGYYYLSATSQNPAKLPTIAPPINGAIYVHCNKIRHIMASAAEAEVGALFANEQDAVGLGNTLFDMGHEQPPTPIKTDNSTAAGFANNTMKQRPSEAKDMRFYWIRDRVQQHQFHIYWRPGTKNLGDSFTKHHSAAHHRMMRPIYLQPTPNGSKYAHSNSLSLLRGCVNSHLLPRKYPRTTHSQALLRWRADRQ